MYIRRLIFQSNAPIFVWFKQMFFVLTVSKRHSELSLWHNNDERNFKDWRLCSGCWRDLQVINQCQSVQTDGCVVFAEETGSLKSRLSVAMWNIQTLTANKEHRAGKFGDIHRSGVCWEKEEVSLFGHEGKLWLHQDRRRS